MYKWKIKIILKSGKEIMAYYEGKENNSVELVNNNFLGKECNYVGFYANENKTENVLVKLGEIAAISIFF